MDEKTFQLITEAISIERDRQEQTWGAQSHSDTKWLAILVEEVGEVAKAVLEGHTLENRQQEILQVAAVCYVWLENMSESANS